MFKNKSNFYKVIVGTLSVICSAATTVLVVHLIVWAGNLDPSSAPGDTMYTLDDIYCAMSIDCTPDSYSIDSPGSAASTMRTLEEIYNKAVNFPIPDTGQATCYDATGDAITCGNSPAGQDAEYTSSNSFTCDMSTTSFTDNGDGTVTDNCTGLMWKKCSEPDTSTTTCGGTHSTYTWANALGQCEGLSFAGHADWRLPNIKELFSVVVEENPAISGVKALGAPYINQTVFPSTVSSNYWSSTTIPDDTSYALYVYFLIGYTSDGNKTNSRYVRCVRGQ